MKIKLSIPTVGDGGNTINSSFLFRAEEKDKILFSKLYSKEFVKPKGTGFIYKSRGLNNRGEKVINCGRVTIGNNKDDPVLHTISTTINDSLFPTKVRDNKKTNFMNTITFKYINGSMMLFYGRTNKRYYINGILINKADLIKAISKIILRASLTRCRQQLFQYMRKVTLFPHNVLYALENRTPYHFQHEMRKTEVVINTKLINEEECVLEISDGIWGALKTKELSTFIDYFKYNKKRSKTWKVGITNEFLWEQLMGEPPSRTELSKMTQWLLQHRTSDLIEDRATKLLFDIAAENPAIDFVQFRNPQNKALFVHGKYSDWVIVYIGKGMKRGTQDVVTYQIKTPSKEKGNWHGMHLSGSICIDNVSRGSSIGDQLVARALALVDERIAAHHLYTIKPLITTKLINGDVIMPRLDRKKLNSWNQSKANEYALKQEQKRNVK